MQISNGVGYSRSQSKKTTNAIACFMIKSDSYVEVRDCNIKSTFDKELFDKALDHYISSKFQARQGLTITYSDNLDAQQRMDNEKSMAIINENIRKEFLEKMRLKDNEIDDYCFVLNFPSLVSDLDAKCKPYSGLVSLTSTNINNFQYGIFCGRDSILTSDQSSFVNLRHG
jgi:hypothetical protein